MEHLNFIWTDVPACEVGQLIQQKEIPDKEIASHYNALNVL